MRRYTAMWSRRSAAIAAGVLLTSVLTVAVQPFAHAAGPNLLRNPGLESGLTGWVNSGTAGSAYVQGGNAHAGTSNLAHYASTAWSVSTVQTVTGLTAGTYTFSAWVKNWGVTSAGLQAYDCGDTSQSIDLPVTAAWQQVTLVVSVRASACTVGIWSNSNTSSLVADDFQFSMITTGAGGSMPVGGDITYRRMTAAMGGRWADASGTQRDVLDILAASGFNLARIRIYNQPGVVVNANGTNYQLQPGWQDLADAVQNAKDAKARGMKLFISLHYSDFWTNPGLQVRPAAWRDYSQAQLESATYDFTRTVMSTLQSNGVTPDFISIGNEINNSLMGVSRTGSPANYYGLLKQGAAAVRSISPATRVVVHLTAPNRTFYSTWISAAKTYGFNYDVLGVSLYPFWTGMSIASLANFASWVGGASGKQVMVCEVGYPWTTQAQGAGEVTMIKDNSLDPDGPENYGATPDGQLRYMREYLRAMYSTGRVAGIAYWDPIWVDLSTGSTGGADPNGWVVGGDNSVEDTTFFNYANPHVALPGLGAFRTW
jgi:arabinogalactan endo-1,4-beta-galactosidase